MPKTFEDDLTQEVIRVLAAGRAASRKGKRTRATVQVDRLAKQHGKDRRTVDTLAGICILNAGLRGSGDWAKAIQETLDQFKGAK